eukprot:1297587-Ditylum_brightwellii.AAC.1
MYERFKVRILNKNIKTDFVDTVKVQILGDPKLQENYYAYTSLYKTFISQTNSMKKNAINVSFTTITTAKRKLDMAVENWYFSKEKYNTMPATQNEQLWKIHKSDPKHHALKKGEKSKDNIQVSKKKLVEMTCKLVVLESKAKRMFTIDTDTDTDTDTNIEPTNQPTTGPTRL